MTNQMVLLAAAAAAALLLTGCDGRKGGQAAKPTDAKPVVYTTFYPTTYFTQRIAGDAVKVVCPCPADEDAIFWMPDAETVRAYQAADLIVVNGAAFEKWVDKVSLPASKVVDTAKGFHDEFVTFKHAVKHKHGPGGEHTHEGVDGHTWVDPLNAKRQAAAIRDALVKAFPQNKETFEKNYAALAADLDALDAEFRALVADYNNEPLLASHPAYNYVAKRYGWNVKNLDLDPEAMPSDEQFAEIKATLASHPAKYLIWESAPRPEIAKRFKEELGLVSVEFSPAELVEADELGAGVDYLTIMRENIGAIAPAFKAADGGA